MVRSVLLFALEICYETFHQTYFATYDNAISRLWFGLVQNAHRCYTNTIKVNHLNYVRAFFKKEPRFIMTLALF